MPDDWSHIESLTAEAVDDGDFILRLDAYEGPIELLLDQARTQKVDLAQISILALADQYLAFIERARRLSLELAAQYLVMAAWLAYLKSRLLLPVPPEDDEPTGAELAEALTFQLRRLEAMQNAGAGLMGRPRLGRDVFSRGAPDAAALAPATAWSLSLYELLKAYADHRSARNAAGGVLHIEASRLHSIEDALRWLSALLGRLPSWTTLATLLPPRDGDPLVARSALAATFAASLELAKAGRLALRQDGAFGPIWMRARDAAA